MLLSLPWVYVMFDLLENAVVLVLLDSYPKRLDMLARSLPYATITKRVASLLAIGVPLMIFGFRALRQFQKTKMQHGAND
jgi:hypothetical protein